MNTKVVKYNLNYYLKKKKKPDTWAKRDLNFSQFCEKLNVRAL